mmetsp:Transcript_84408/g.212845  ORF Transcript_84408/g.212845 Transcript_84408/m.212845 type:complete len:207 (-) Transcript_84408:23-643(-)
MQAIRSWAFRSLVGQLQAVASSQLPQLALVARPPAATVPMPAVPRLVLALPPLVLAAASSLRQPPRHPPPDEMAQATARLRTPLWVFRSSQGLRLEALGSSQLRRPASVVRPAVALRELQQRLVVQVRLHLRLQPPRLPLPLPPIPHSVRHGAPALALPRWPPRARPKLPRTRVRRRPTMHRTSAERRARRRKGWSSGASASCGSW